MFFSYVHIICYHLGCSFGMYIHIARAQKKRDVAVCTYGKCRGAQLDMLFSYVHIICYMLDAHFRCTYIMPEFRMLI